MVEMSAIAPGMRVKIVDEYTYDCLANEDGLMDDWRGQIMTVRAIDGNVAKMVEDSGEWAGSGWFWNKHCIDYIVLSEPEVESLFDAPEESAILSLFV